MKKLKATLRKTWPVLVSYGLFSIWGVGCFVASLVLTSGGFGLDAGSTGALVGVLVATAIGHVAGNLLGLARLRLMPVIVVFVLLFVGVTMSGVALGVFAVFLFVAALAALGGYLGIASRLDVVAAWYPLVFSVGGAVTWMNRHDAVGTFIEGKKHAMWDPFTIACLGGSVFFMLVFLATRHGLGLTVWQEIGRGRVADDATTPSVNVARPGRGSILVLLGFTIVVLGTTALVAPYLFRTKTEEGDGKGESKGKAKPDHGEGYGKGKGYGSNEGDGKPMGDPDMDGAGQAAKEALDLGLKIFLALLAAAALILLFLLVLLPPMRRRFLLRHLEKPLWPVAPTARVMNLWRRALVDLAVLQIEPAAGEPPRDFARRAEGELVKSLGSTPAEGKLAAAAAIVEKIHYAGRGLGAGEEETMREAATAFVKALEPHLATKKKLAAAWGPAPEVEA